MKLPAVEGSWFGPLPNLAAVEGPLRTGRLSRPGLLILQRHLSHTDGLTCKNAAACTRACSRPQRPDVRIQRRPSTSAVAGLKIKIRCRTGVVTAFPQLSPCRGSSALRRLRHPTTDQLQGPLDLILGKLIPSWWSSSRIALSHLGYQHQPLAELTNPGEPNGEPTEPDISCT